MAGDRGAAVLIARLAERIEALLAVDQREARHTGVRSERLVGLDVAAQIGEDQRVIGDGGFVVEFCGLGDRRAAAEGGEDEEGQRDVGDDESGARGALSEAPPGSAMPVRGMEM